MATPVGGSGYPSFEEIINQPKDIISIKNFSEKGMCGVNKWEYLEQKEFLKVTLWDPMEENHLNVWATTVLRKMILTEWPMPIPFWIATPPITESKNGKTGYIDIRAIAMEQEDINDLSWATQAQKLALAKGQINNIHKKEDSM